MIKTIFLPRYVIEMMEGTYREILISINGTGDDPVKLKGDWRDVLRMEFDDIDIKTPECILFNKEYARNIINFLKGFENDDENLVIIVHCNAGISRSAAVAKFVADFYAIEEFNHKYSLYNKHVYNILMNEWHGSIYNLFREKEIE